MTSLRKMPYKKQKKSNTAFMIERNETVNYIGQSFLSRNTVKKYRYSYSFNVYKYRKYF